MRMRDRFLNEFSGRLWLTIVLCLYVAAFFALRDTKMPALNGKYEIVFKTSYQLYSADSVNGVAHCIFIALLFLNYLFYPLETLFRQHCRDNVAAHKRLPDSM
jgi:hypothetical protein